MKDLNIDVGPRDVIELAQCRVFSARMCELVRAMDLPSACFADVLCASLASIAEIHGSDPASRMQALDAYHAVARKQLQNLMTQGAAKQ